MEKQSQSPTGKIVLADGTCQRGYLFGGGHMPVWGELVFNTSMTGYQEVITDPSYAGQIIIMTYPQIGNYGVTLEDSEKPECAARALVVRELSRHFSPGPGRISLEEFMREQGMAGITGVDTRALTLHVRSQGSVVAAIGPVETSNDELRELAMSRRLGDERLVAAVSGSMNGARAGELGRIAVIDLGLKKSILDNVAALKTSVHVFDSEFRAEEVLSGDFECVVISNGPGDPTDILSVTDEVAKLIGKIPLLGICLGHQMIALALGGSTYKLKFGHHGANQPVIDHRTGRVLITSQNHGYAVSDDIAALPGAAITYTNASDGTLEGFVVDEKMIECVQFHPEGAPGPHDTRFIFHQFYERVKGWRNATNA